MTATTEPTREDASLLEQQLRDALVDASAARSPAFEVALLAGLRERMPGRSAIVDEVDEWLESAGADQLAAELPRIRIQSRAEPLLNPMDVEPDDERIDALLAFDELCAGFTFCGAAQRCEPAAELVARAIRARPEAWAAISDFASRVLQRAPPLAEDPAGRVWRAVEVAQALAMSAGPSPAAVSPLLQFEREPMRLAASTGGPRVQKRPLGSSTQVVFIESAEGSELLLEVEGEAATVSAERGGHPVALTVLRPGTWACPAEAGLYVFTINGKAYPVQVD